MDLGLMAIIASGVFAVILAFIWYHPSIFGGAWMRMSGISPEMAERGKRRMPIMVIFALLSIMLVAYVMSYVSLAWGFYDPIGAVKLGVWCWLGFVAPVLLGSVLWEQRPFSLFLINAGYWLIVMLVMAQILVFASAATYSPYSDSDALESGMYVGE